MGTTETGAVCEFPLPARNLSKPPGRYQDPALARFMTGHGWEGECLPRGHVRRSATGNTPPSRSCFSPVKPLMTLAARIASTPCPRDSLTLKGLIALPTAGITGIHCQYR